MSTDAYCTRCRRHIGEAGDDVAAVCSGCLTAAEDAEETYAVVLALAAGTTDPAEIVDAVLGNLESRLTGGVRDSRRGAREASGASGAGRPMLLVNQTQRVEGLDG